MYLLMIKQDAIECAIRAVILVVHGLGPSIISTSLPILTNCVTVILFGLATCNDICRKRKGSVHKVPTGLGNHAQTLRSLCHARTAGSKCFIWEVIIQRRAYDFRDSFEIMVLKSTTNV